jgi:hypothetical protein
MSYCFVSNSGEYRIYVFQWGTRSWIMHLFGDTKFWDNPGSTWATHWSFKRCSPDCLDVTPDFMPETCLCWSISSDVSRSRKVFFDHHRILLTAYHIPFLFVHLQVKMTTIFQKTANACSNNCLPFGSRVTTKFDQTPVSTIAHPQIYRSQIHSNPQCW